MTRWILLVMALLGLVLVFTGKTGGMVAIGLLLALVGLIGFVLSLAAARVAAASRPDAAMASPDELVALGRRAAGTPSPPPRPAPGGRAPRSRS
ncbi:MAG: hypothetical protein J0H15_05685 [Xanthomonadales bacterium]|nr:hypothetical protein [Xanthomonadales bacterium]